MNFINYFTLIFLVMCAVQSFAQFDCQINENSGKNDTMVSQNQLMQCSIRATMNVQPFEKISRLLGNLREKQSSNGADTEKMKELPRHEDPIQVFERAVHRFMFGPNIDNTNSEQPNREKLFEKPLMPKNGVPEDRCAQFPTGTIDRAELFNKRTSVHLPPFELLHKGHCYLKITNDSMQTALDAFAIFVAGNLDDVNRLPPDYVLKSARAISMIKAAREKLASTWAVVKRGMKTVTIPYETLELYRPLFKYINGREIARLNLSDDRILTFIGTHPDLNRHQVGVVASKYMQLNPRWSDTKYLNMMNNLLCGVPMTFMRKIESNVYLQLTHQALGKSYSWSARDVSRLGLLLAEVNGPDLAAINPEAISGITAQVMMQMPAQSLQYITEVQLRYLGLKPLNILARRLKEYQGQLKVLSHSPKSVPCLFTSLLLVMFSLIMII